MKTVSKIFIAILVSGLSGLMITSCSTSDSPVASENGNPVAIQLVFPEIINAVGLNKITAIQEITVSVVDLETIDLFAGELSDKPAVLIKEQALQISGGVAQGFLDIPVTSEKQTFQIIVFASDYDENEFYSGSTEIELEQDQEDAEVVPIIMGQAVSITSLGTVSASSVFTPGNFGPEEGNDLDFESSWFSAGIVADPEGAVYTWNAPSGNLSQRFIGTMGVFNNSLHANPEFRTGFGFEQVNYKVFNGPDATGEVLFDETIDYPKTAANPVFRVSPMVFGQSVQLTLTGHESDECGGFAELLIVNPLASQVQSLSVSPQIQTAEVGAMVTYSALANFVAGQPFEATGFVTWSSSDTTVATIDSAGVATAVGTGVTTISASLGEAFGSASLTVAEVTTGSGPVISNINVTLIQAPDSARCAVFSNNRVGNSYEVSCSYSDMDGDVVTGTSINFSYKFNPSGTSGTFSTAPTLTGNGTEGTASSGVCFIFESNTGVGLTVSITDSQGNNSNAITVSFPKPPGGNSPSRGEGLVGQCTEMN